MNVYYLNNNGNRFVVRNKDNRNTQVRLQDGAIRRAKYFQMFGNSAFVCVHLHGKLVKTFNYELVN